MFDLARILIEALILATTWVEVPPVTPKSNTSPAPIVAPIQEIHEP